MMTKTFRGRISKLLFGLVWVGSGLIHPAMVSLAAASQASGDSPPGRLPANMPVPLQVAVLRTGELQNNQHFGFSVDISGDTAVVGAPETDITINDVPQPDAGLVFVFKRGQDGSWGMVNALSGATQAGSKFGAAVAIDGDTIIVGAPYYDGFESPNEGRVFIYERNLYGEDYWGLAAFRTSPRASKYDYFGSTVDISGGFAVVGAYEEDCDGCDWTENSGSAFILARDMGGSNQWGFTAELRAASPQAAARFGSAVAIQGQNIIVSAVWEDFGSVVDAGAAYIFSLEGPTLPNQGLSPSAWEQKARLTASDAASEDRYGFSVDIEGDHAVVGAIWEDGGAGDLLPDAGAAYVYTRLLGETVTWEETAILHSSDALSNDGFGISLNLEGDRLVVGAYLEDGGPDDPLSNAGALYLFERNRGGEDMWGQTFQILASEQHAEDRLGISVAMSGDLIIGGAFMEDGGAGSTRPDTGAANIFEMSDQSVYLPVVVRQ